MWRVNWGVISDVSQRQLDNPNHIRVGDRLRFTITLAQETSSNQEQPISDQMSAAIHSQNWSRGPTLIITGQDNMGDPISVLVRHKASNTLEFEYHFRFSGTKQLRFTGTPQEVRLPTRVPSSRATSLFPPLIHEMELVVEDSVIQQESNTPSVQERRSRNRPERSSGQVLSNERGTLPSQLPSILNIEPSEEEHIEEHIEELQRGINTREPSPTHGDWGIGWRINSTEEGQEHAFLGTLTEPIIQQGQEIDIFLRTPNFPRRSIRPSNRNFWRHNLPVLELTRNRTNLTIHVMQHDPRDIRKFTHNFQITGAWFVEIKVIYTPPGSLVVVQRFSVSMRLNILEEERYLAMIAAQQNRVQVQQARAQVESRVQEADFFEQHSRLLETERGRVPGTGMSEAPPRLLPDGRIRGNLILPQEATISFTGNQLEEYFESINRRVQQIRPLNINTEHINNILLTSAQRRLWRYRLQHSIDSEYLYLRFIPRSNSPLGRRPLDYSLRYRLDEIIVLESEGKRILLTAQDLKNHIDLQQIFNFLEVISLLADLMFFGEGAFFRITGREIANFGLRRLRRQAAQQTRRLILQRFRRTLGIHIAPGVGRYGRRVLLVQNIISQLVTELLDTGYNILKQTIKATLQELHRQLNLRTLEDWQRISSPNNSRTTTIINAAANGAAEQISNEIVGAIIPSRSEAARSLQAYLYEHFKNVIRSALSNIISTSHRDLLVPARQQTQNFDDIAEIGANSVENEFDEMVFNALNGTTVIEQLEAINQRRDRQSQVEQRRLERGRRLRRRRGRSRTY